MKVNIIIMNFEMHDCTAQDKTITTRSKNIVAIQIYNR